MDLVVTVDTAVAHSAGALGVPTWIVPSFVANWPRLRRREDNPRDPTLRLFRQASPGHTPNSFTQVAKALPMHIQMEKVPRFDRPRGWSRKICHTRAAPWERNQGILPPQVIYSEASRTTLRQEFDREAQ